MSYKQSTFSTTPDVPTPAPVVDAPAITAPEIVIPDPTATPTPAAPIVDTPPAAVVDPPVPDVPADPNAEPTDTTEFAFAVPGDEPVNPNPNEPPAPATSQATTPFNLDEEIKKVDRKELLKKLDIPEFAIELAEHLRNGGAASDYLTARAIDYTKVSDEELIKADMRAAYPHLEPEKIEKLFNSRYRITEFATDADREIAEIQMQADAGLIRTKKITEQQKFKVPDSPVNQVDPGYAEWKEQSANAAAAIEQHNTFVLNHEATKSLNESKKIALNFGEGVRPLNMKIGNPELITRALTDDGTILNRFLTTNTGQLDVAKQQLVTLFAADPQQFINKIFNYGQQVGVYKKVVGEGQNASRPAGVVQMNRADGKATYGQGKFGDRQR